MSRTTSCKLLHHHTLMTTIIRTVSVTGCDSVVTVLAASRYCFSKGLTDGTVLTVTLNDVHTLESTSKWHDVSYDYKMTSLGSISCLVSTRPPHTHTHTYTLLASEACLGVVRREITVLAKNRSVLIVVRLFFNQRPMTGFTGNVRSWGKYRKRKELEHVGAIVWDIGLTVRNIVPSTENDHCSGRQ